MFINKETGYDPLNGLNKFLAVLLCICTTTILFTGCGSSNDEETSISAAETLTTTETETTEVIEGTEVLVLYKTITHNKSQNRTEETVYEYDNKGRIIKELYEDSSRDLKESMEYSYDDNDNIIEEKQYESGRLKESVQYKYDNNGNIIEKNTYQNNKNECSKYEYDDNNVLIKEVKIGEDGVEKIEQYSEFDENGNRIKFFDCYDMMNEYEYENNILIKWSEYRSDNSLLRAHTYDNNGYEIEIVHYYSDGQIEKVEEFEYDEKGILLKETSTNGNDELNYWRKYEYDENGNVVMNENLYKSELYQNNTLHECFKHTYGETNKLIETSYYYSNTEEMQLDWSEKYEYDENGNILKMSTYSYSDTEPYEWVEYEYITIRVIE